MDVVRLGGGDRLAEEVDEDDHGERKVDPAPTFAHASPMLELDACQLRRFAVAARQHGGARRDSGRRSCWGSESTI